MNKNDLIVSPAEELELTRSYARDLVGTIFQKITEAASQGEEVAVFGFGRFKVVVRGARKGRNPRTGEAVQIAAKKVLKFEAAKAMKDGLNAKKRGRRKAARSPRPRDRRSSPTAGKVLQAALGNVAAAVARAL